MEPSSAIRAQPLPSALEKLRNQGQRWLSAHGGERPVFELALFLLTFALLFFAVPFGDRDTIIGDNIAQVGYWRILFEPRLTGSIGAASMKPGLILLLGAAHDVSLALFHSTVLIKVVFALFGAGLSTVVARIAKDAGGVVAGILAATYLLTRTPVLGMYANGTSMIVFMPLLLCGAWLFGRERQRAGTLVLCMAALIRIEALAVLGWVSVSEQLLRRRWRAFAFTAAMTTLTILLTAFIYYRLQGSLARFNAGGPPAGYLFTRDPDPLGRLWSSLAYTVAAIYENLVVQCRFPCLAVPALLGLGMSPARRSYAALLGIPVFLNVYIGSGNGSPEPRYFHFLLPVAAAFGVAGLAYCFTLKESKGQRLALGVTVALGVLAVVAYLCSWKEIAWSALLAAAVSALSFASASLCDRVPALVRNLGWASVVGAGMFLAFRGAEWPEVSKKEPYILDADALLEGETVPRGMRVMTEDDVIYTVIAKDLGFFREATPLPYFNVQSDERRGKILAATDYIVLSRRKYYYYFLRYDPLGRGRRDPFRALMMSARRHAEPAELYGQRLAPLESSKRWIVYKVEHPAPAP